MKRGSRVFKKIALLLVLTLIIGLAAACAAPEETVVIGAILPEDEESAALYEQAVNGVSLALSEINSQGGILGKAVEIVYVEDKISKNGLIGMVCFFGSDKTESAMLVCRENGIPAITVGSIDAEIDLLVSAQAAEMIKDGMATAAVIYERSDYGKQLSFLFKEKYKSIGGAVPVDESYIAEYDRDFSFIFDKMPGLGIDAILLIGHLAEGADFFDRAKELEPEAPVYEMKIIDPGDFDWTMHWYDAVMHFASCEIL